MTRMNAMFRLLVCAGALALMSTGHSAQAADKKASAFIRPGKSLGNIALGSDGAAVSKQYGSPVNSDGAAGHVWETYKVRTGVIDVYSGMVGEKGHRVLLVRTTSKYYRTSSGIRTGTTLRRIRRRFPNLTQLSTYRSSRFGKTVVLLGDVKRGIAFEVARGEGKKLSASARCLSILVHAPRVKPNMSLTRYPE